MKALYELYAKRYHIGVTYLIFKRLARDDQWQYITDQGPLVLNVIRCLICKADTRMYLAEYCCGCVNILESKTAQ